MNIAEQIMLGVALAFSVFNFMILMTILFHLFGTKK